jgi:uncharacterized protein YbaA (DUF1428 family)
MRYVDGFVLPVPKKNLKEYRKMATAAGKIWKKHGALEYFECFGDDLNPKTGGMKISHFPKMAKAKSGETVIFAFIVYKSKAHRDKVNARVMRDPAMNDPEFCKNGKMPFNPKRMAYGGFRAFVDL